MARTEGTEERMSAALAEANEEWWRGEPPQHYEYPDKAGKGKEWDGWLLVQESTALPASVQWTMMEVYLTVAGHYVLRVLGCSVIYHRHNSLCNTGDPTRGQDMDDDMRPCPRCRPAGNYKTELHDNTVFDAEVEIPTITLAETPDKLLLAMRTRNGVVGDLSYIAAKVLRRLTEVDPAVARMMRKPDRLE